MDWREGGGWGLSAGRVQRMAGARRAPQAWGRFSAKESRVSERVRVCLGVYVRGSGSECWAVQGRFHGWLITGVRASTLATAARPCRHCLLPPQPTHTHLLHPYSAQRGPACTGTAQSDTAAPDRPHSLLTMATVWGMHEEKGEKGGSHANGVSERETQQPLLSPY